MDQSLNELPVTAVVEAVKANWVEFYACLGHAPGAELTVGPHLSWLLTGVPDSFLNVVFRTELPPEGGDAIVDEALRHFRGRRIARLSWWVDGPVSEVGGDLRRRGLAFEVGGTAMAADLRTTDVDVVLPAGLEIVPVEDWAALQPWIRVMRVGFGLPEATQERLLTVFGAVSLEPPMHTFLALLDGRPVATSQLFVGAGVAGIYNVTCLPEARGRGIGGAVTHAAMLAARRQGYGLAVLQASDLGYPVYRRLGFEDFGHLNSYQLRSDDAGSTT